MPTPYLKNKGPLLVDKVRGYFDRLPPWLRDVVTVRVEKQKVDAKITDLDASALESELKQEVTDEKLKTSRFWGNGEPGSGNDATVLPASHPSQVVLTQTGQVAAVTETVSATETHLTEGPPLQDGMSEKVGDVWVTRKVEASTFNRQVFQKQVDDLLPAKFRASIPQTLIANTVNGVAAMPTLGANDQLKKEEQTKVGVKEVFTQARDLSGAKPALIGQKIDNDFNGAVVNTVEEIVPNGTAITPGFGSTQLAVTPYDDKNSVSERSQAVAFPTIQISTYDPEVNTEVVSIIDVVAMGNQYTPTVGVLDYQERKIDSKHTLRIRNSLRGVPPVITTYGTQMITFPAILQYISFQLVKLAAPNRSAVQFTPGIRSQVAVPTRTITHTEFFFDQPPAVNPIQWRPADIMYKGLSYSISWSNILCDAWTNIGVTYAGDEVYGNAVDRFSIAATAPSASTYVSWIGTNQPISCVIERYKRLWVRKTTYVLIN